MAKQTINVGTTANDGTGDTIRAASIKINENFTEVYTNVSALQTSVSTLSGEDHLSNVVEDTTPQLGGNLDTNGNNITGTGDINLADGDTGFVFDTSTGYATFNSDGAAALTFQNPAFGTGIGQVFSVGSFGSLTIEAVDGGSISIQPEGNLQLDYSIWPVSDGTDGQVLTTGGDGSLSWTDKTVFVDLTGYATENYVDLAVNNAINSVTDSDNQTLALDANTGVISISGGNTVDLTAVLLIPENNIIANTVAVNTMESAETDSSIVLNSPMQMASFTTAQRDGLVVTNGAMIYNSDTGTFQGLANNQWVDLH